MLSYFTTLGSTVYPTFTATHFQTYNSTVSFPFIVAEFTANKKTLPSAYMRSQSSTHSITNMSTVKTS